MVTLHGGVTLDSCLALSNLLFQTIKSPNDYEIVWRLIRPHGFVLHTLQLLDTRSYNSFFRVVKLLTS